MKYKNFSLYVQQQIDRILQFFHHFVCAYVDDIMIFSKNLEEHQYHLNQIFSLLNYMRIILNSAKSYLDYLSIILLRQRVDAFELTTSEKKLNVNIKLTFLHTLKDLKTYLDMTKWLRNYVSYYAQVIEPLQ